MKKQELYNKIRTRINELVPRMKDLIFGCEFKRKNHNTLGIKEPKMYIIANHTFSNSQFLQNTNGMSIQKNNDEKVSGYYWIYDGEVFCRKISFEEFNSQYEIIGHTPYLEDLLEAIETPDLNTEYLISNDGYIYRRDRKELTLITPTSAKYNLSLSLENQSLETLESLNKLLN